MLLIAPLRSRLLPTNLRWLGLLCLPDFASASRPHWAGSGRLNLVPSAGVQDFAFRVVAAELPQRKRIGREELQFFVFEYLLRLPGHMRLIAPILLLIALLLRLAGLTAVVFPGFGDLAGHP